MAIKNPLKGKILLNSSNMINEWFYMNENTVTADDLNSSLSKIPGFNIECWPEAGILEITSDSGKSIDFELTEPKFSIPEDNQYLIKHNIKTLYYVTFVQADYEKAISIFKEITAAHKGMFCADTENFEPRIGFILSNQKIF